MRALFVIVLFVLFSQSLAAATAEVYAFESDQQKARFENLTQQFRCLVCQNESLADSNAPLAQDLRGQVAVLVKQHKTDKEITEYLVTRYGDFILFKPPLIPSTYLLWLWPLIMFAIGIIIVVTIVRKHKNTPEQ